LVSILTCFSIILGRSLLVFPPGRPRGRMAALQHGRAPAGHALVGAKCHRRTPCGAPPGENPTVPLAQIAPGQSAAQGGQF
jgi:hypothetical protein